ncbi:MAG: T9SS type A sorting domain-containing protein, partial [Candidatus Neomarinimicrobiota bacterium]|nr:T9SS type A sorting domain-containing protein [Candidatus Neomarinimicrobiota bacterium]
LGIGWINNSCQTISGCGWVVDSVDYSEAFFSTMDECTAAASLEIDYTYPTYFYLHQNHPNPFNPVTSLRYDLPEDGLVNITVYDMMGRIVKTLVNNSQTAGYKSIQWNATNDRDEPISAGLYLYTIQAGGLRQTKKMVLLK